mmetsp:Transcript_64650/g.179833  ORF Transcript_64650/g.179833 Transcript_64650/m.179833 type:complete len:218 (+) Transcript_64650:169-822(+)
MPIGGIPMGGMPIGGMPIIGGIPIMPIIEGMPIIVGIGPMGIRGVSARLFASDMNFAEGFLYPDKSHRSATACCCGGNDLICLEALSSRSLSSIYLAMASGVAPIMAPPQAVHGSLVFIRSFCDWSSRTRAIITFDGFWMSPVSGRAMTRRWLSGLNALIFVEASSLILLSSMKRSTSSTRSGGSRRLLLRLRFRRGGGGERRSSSSQLPLSFSECS